MVFKGNNPIFSRTNTPSRYQKHPFDEGGALQWILGGNISQKDFLEHVWERKPLHIQREDTGRTGALYKR
jgi:hypothetical protein